MSQLRKRGRAKNKGSSSAIPPGGDWLRLQSLDMNLSGSGIHGLQTGQDSPRGGGQARPLSLGLEKLEVTANPFHCLDAPVQLKMAASGIEFKSQELNGVKSFSIDLREGRIALEIDRADLEELVLKLAREALRPEGIDVRKVKLGLESLSRRDLRIRARLTAQKGFVTATLEISGVFVVNDSLQGRLEDFEIRGEGVIASLVARYLRPQLESAMQQELELGIAVLGCLSLTDIEFHAADTLRIVGRFGGREQRPRPRELKVPTRPTNAIVASVQRQFHVYIIDTGSNVETRQLLDESRQRYATHLERHVVCELTPAQSKDLLRLHPDLVGTDPIVLAVDRAAAAEKRSSGLGFRYNMGAVADRNQAGQMLKKLFEILGEQHQAADITAAVRRHARKEGFRGTLDILDSTFRGFGSN